MRKFLMLSILAALPAFAVVNFCDDFCTNRTDVTPANAAFWNVKARPVHTNWVSTGTSAAVAGGVARTAVSVGYGSADEPFEGRFWTEAFAVDAITLNTKPPRGSLILVR